VTAIQVRVPPELHDRLRRRAAEHRVTLSAFVVGVLQREVGRPTTREWFASLSDREPVRGADVRAAVAAGRDGDDAGRLLRDRRGRAR
jgi:predicted transcriptional regulator